MTLLTMRNFEVYHPVDKEPGLYLRDELGRDWYEWNQRFRKDTLKVVFDDVGCITTLSWLGWDVNPENQSITEVPAEEVPGKFRVDGSWFYLDGKIVQTADGREEFCRRIRGAFLKATDTLVIPDYTRHDHYLTADQTRELWSCRLAWKRWPKQPGWHCAGHPEIPVWVLEEAVKCGFDIRHLDDLNTL